MRRFVSYGPAIIVSLTILLALAIVPMTVREATFAAERAKVILARQTLEDDDLLKRLDDAFTRIAQATGPSVVHIDVRSRSGRRSMSGATGAGWVFDEHGHIVTNAHVVNEADVVLVQFSDGRVEEARVQGTDRSTDVAVLKVDSLNGHLPLPRASGVIPRQGQLVFAFGSPFGFKFSMSQGIISGLGRSPAGAVEFGGSTNFIQTDAAVNPGNSGGPLVDSSGRVIGMNVAIATGRDTDGTTEGQSAGISFAIPLSTVEYVAEQLIAGHEPSRGFLGITLPSLISTVVPDGSFQGTGVYVPAVVEDGPADEAGIEIGDIILRIDGERTPRVPVLQSVIASKRPGQVVDIELWREHHGIRSVDLHVGEMTARQRKAQTARGALERFGLHIEDSDAGPMIEDVLRGFRASRLDFETGQVITQVAGESVSNTEDVYVALADAGFLVGGDVSVTVHASDGERLRLTIELPR